MTQQAPPPLRNSAAGRLRQLMEAAGLSTMDLAQQLGCSRSTAYRRLRTGPRSIEEVILLAGLLNVKPYQVLRGTAPIFGERTHDPD